LARGSKAQQDLEGSHGLPAAIVTKDELIQVSGELIATDTVIGSEAVPERMGSDVLSDACMLRGLGHGSPDNLLSDGYVGPPFVDRAGE